MEWATTLQEDGEGGGKGWVGHICKRWMVVELGQQGTWQHRGCSTEAVDCARHGSCGLCSPPSTAALALVVVVQRSTPACEPQACPTLHAISRLSCTQQPSGVPTHMLVRPPAHSHATLHFSCGVMDLARVLGREPRIGVEIWHKERWVGRAEHQAQLGGGPGRPVLVREAYSRVVA